MNTDRTCPNCGAEVPYYRNICPSCYRTMPVPEPTEPPPPEPEEPPVGEGSPPEVEPGQAPETEPAPEPAAPPYSPAPAPYAPAPPPAAWEPQTGKAPDTEPEPAQPGPAPYQPPIYPQAQYGPPQYPPPPGTPGAAPPPEPRADDTLAIVGLIMGVLGIACCGCLSILSPIGLIMSIVAHNRRPTGLSLAGIIIGAVGSLLFLVSVAWSIYVTMNPEVYEEMIRRIFEQLDMPMPPGFPTP